MSAEPNEVKVHVPVVVFAFNFNLDGTRENYNSVTAQYHVPIDTPLEEMHGYSDKIVDVVDRQRHRYRLYDLQRALKATTEHLSYLETERVHLHAQTAGARKGGGKNGGTQRALTTAERTQVAQAAVNVDNDRRTIERLTAEIAAVEAILGLTESATR